MGTPRIRRATASDTDSVARLVPGLVPSATEDHRATFLFEDAADELRGVLDLTQHADRLVIEHLATLTPEASRSLLDFADVTARALGVRHIDLAPGALPPSTAAPEGFRDGRRKVPRGHLETIGVPLWRDGPAAFSTSLYYRGVWAAVALLVGFGSISAAVFSRGELTLTHIVLPALLCVAGILFALWQILLTVQAARRGASRAVFAVSAVSALAIALLIAGGVTDRALPSLTELWNIYTGDAELGDLQVSLGADGRTLYVQGSYGLRSEEAVRRALAEHPSIRDVVLAGPGGRIGVGYELFRLFRNRKLNTRVETACASACTIAFLGGLERSVAPGAKLGFHSASFPGMSESDMYDANRDIRQFLIYSARVTPAFAQKVVDTPGDGIWIPTPEELLAGKVVTRITAR
jgi:hypothetical protein